jgi:hypothetical protein
MAYTDGRVHLPTTQQMTSVKICPAPTPVFTGQGEKIKRVTDCISRGDKERCVFVIHGLGGAGKTQLALKTIERTRDMWSDIVYVDATSTETTVSTLEAFAKAKKIGQTLQDAIRWLGSQQERWLVVFDNADDPSLKIKDFFPPGDHGSILITTRLQSLAMFARGPHSDYAVSSMKPEEAMELLLKTARVEDTSLSGVEHKEAVQLLEVSLIKLLQCTNA